MNPQTANLIIDCGTTNLRVTLTGARHLVLDTVRAAGGVRLTAADGHNGRLKQMLREAIETLLSRNGLTAEAVGRCIAYGMITGNLGLCEVPHVAAPASAQTLRAHMRVERFPDVAPFPIEFIPGVRNFADAVDMENFSGMDMMRGEEVEAIGLYRLLGLHEAAVFILPGSHNKFVRMDAEGNILGCMTSISGELLDALTHHTILSDAVKHSFATPADYDAELACEGAWACAESGLGRAAFAGRILHQLGGKEPAALRSYLLGATLALDVQALGTFIPDEAAVQTFVAGKAPVQQAMLDVLEALGREGAMSIDPAISARMGLAGAAAIAFDA